MKQKKKMKTQRIYQNGTLILEEKGQGDCLKTLPGTEPNYDINTLLTEVQSLKSIQASVGNNLLRMEKAN